MEGKFDQFISNEHPIEAKNLPLSMWLNDSHRCLGLREQHFSAQIEVLPQLHPSILFLQSNNG